MRIRYSLRFALLMPCIVAAFFAGYSAHDSKFRRVHEMEEAAARLRRDALLREIAEERAAALRRMQIESHRAPEGFDRMDHQQRMDLFRSRIDGSIEDRVLPQGAYP